MSIGTTTLPLPRWDDSTVVVEPPGDEPGAWSGAPSSIVADGDIYLAYRLRLPIGEGRGIANVVARSADGLVAVQHRPRHGAGQALRGVRLEQFDPPVLGARGGGADVQPPPAPGGAHQRPALEGLGAELFLGHLGHR